VYWTKEDNVKQLADVVEAVFGAVSLDSGLRLSAAEVAVTQLSEAAHEEEYDHFEDWDEDKGERVQRRIFVSLKLKVFFRQFCFKLELLSTRTEKSLREVVEAISTDLATLDQSQSGSQLHGCSSLSAYPLWRMEHRDQG
jgi:dsRNA-specific ribonuclease